MSFPKTLCSSFQSQHFLPVRSHPDKYRKGQRDGNKRHQRDVQQAHLMEKIEIGKRADGQHVMAAWDPLNKCVLIVKRHDIAFAQTLHCLNVQRVLI